MIDLAKIQYRVVVMDESKNQYNIKEYIENLGWEENAVGHFPDRTVRFQAAPTLPA